MKVEIEVKQSKNIPDLKFVEFYKVVWFKKNGGTMVSHNYLDVREAQEALDLHKELNTYSEEEGYTGGLVMTDLLFV